MYQYQVSVLIAASSVGLPTYFFCVCYCVCCARRTARNLSRDRMGVLMRLSQNLIYGLFVAFFVMRLDIDMSKGAVQDRFGIIYQSIGASPYTGMLNAVALCEFSLLHVTSTATLSSHSRKKHLSGETGEECRRKRENLENSDRIEENMQTPQRGVEPATLLL